MIPVGPGLLEEAKCQGGATPYRDPCCRNQAATSPPEPDFSKMNSAAPAARAVGGGVATALLALALAAMNFAGEQQL